MVDFCVLFLCVFVDSYFDVCWVSVWFELKFGDFVFGLLFFGLFFCSMCDESSVLFIVGGDH